MYWLKPGIKNDPELRWNLPDRIFFGYGGCHILAGAFMQVNPLKGFHAEWIVPHNGQSGNHFFVTNGAIVFDFHGYSAKHRLVQHHTKGWTTKYPGWRADIEKVDFSILDTAELNLRKHRGPDQYFGDPVARARRFLARIDHQKGFQLASGTV